MLFDPSLFSSFILMCVIIELTPGPNMAYLVVLSAGNGHRSGFAAVAGITLGLLLVGMAAGLGLTTVIANSPLAYQMLRISGVCYLFWLAWDVWRNDAAASTMEMGSFTAQAKFFRRGLITNLLNPKAAVFYMGMLPNFLRPEFNIQKQAIILTLTSVIIATSVHSLIVLLAGNMHAFLQDKSRRQLVRRVLSLMLAGIAIWFAWSTKVNVL